MRKPNGFSAVVTAMRPKQWTKNLALFVALVFAQKLFVWSSLATELAAFGAFCLLSGAVYLLNDVMDVERDRQHPQKCLRPIAAGTLTKQTALVAMAMVASVGLVWAFAIDREFGLLALTYFMLQLAYSCALKHIVIVDIFCIAASFFLRVFAGAYAIEVAVSSWLLVCTFFISLFIALSKRRHEMVLLEERANEHRQVLEKYDVLLLDQMISVVTSATVVAYAVYTLSGETVTKFGTDNLKYTIPFVIYGIYRYLYLVYRRQQGGSPEVIFLTDVPMIINMALYAGVVGWVLYS
ncbi:decaprenyl-phosphate phosphoribosyltransferase [Planctomycetota bacterium]